MTGRKHIHKMAEPFLFGSRDNRLRHLPFNGGYETAKARCSPVGQCAFSCRGGAPQFRGSPALTVRYEKGRDRSRPSHRCSKISYSSRQALSAGRHAATPQSPALSFFHTHDQFRGMGAPPSVPWGKRAPVALCREPDEAAASSSHGSRAFSTWA